MRVPESEAKTVPRDQDTIHDSALAVTLVQGTDSERVTDLLNDDSFTARYQRGALLGEGGMGEVTVCKDRRIGRDVAMKTVRPGHGSRGDVQKRFLREARVQGQLEHPSIVPVYDLGRDPSGAAYFTMKRLRGMTFEAILEKLHSNDQATAQQFSRRKLLTSFTQVCLAVDFAHTHGVLHRDLKPGNVMLGDFGEVYVLDWGLAKLTKAPDDDAAPPPSARALELAQSDPGTHTVAGAAMGTPGYMAPEQARGEVAELDARTDVYALGAILFEILSLEPLHVRSDLNAMLASTLRGVEARFSARVPDLDVPPELEAIVVRATALDPRDRFESARAMCEALERYLDGDRDHARRTELATDLARGASAHAERALGGDGDQATDARATALRDLGRALALDPQNAAALTTLIRLLTEPPRDLPDDAREPLVAQTKAQAQASWRLAAIAYATWLLFIPLGLWIGIRSFALGAATTIAWIGAGLVAFYYSRKPPRSAPYLALVAGSLATASTTFAFGPYVVLPPIAVAVTATGLLVADRRHHAPVILSGVFAMAVPIALGWLGVLPPPYAFNDDALAILPNMVHFRGRITEVILVLESFVTLLSASVIVSRLRGMLSVAEERLALQAWQLRQLVPPEARSATMAGAGSVSQELCAAGFVRR